VHCLARHPSLSHPQVSVIIGLQGFETGQNQSEVCQSIITGHLWLERDICGHTQSNGTEGVGKGEEEPLFWDALLLFPPVFWLPKHTHYVRNCYCYLSDAE